MRVDLRASRCSISGQSLAPPRMHAVEQHREAQKGTQYAVPLEAPSRKAATLQDQRARPGEDEH